VFHIVDRERRRFLGDFERAARQRRGSLNSSQKIQPLRASSSSSKAAACR
jgi:hypothetical protein